MTTPGNAGNLPPSISLPPTVEVALAQLEGVVPDTTAGLSPSTMPADFYQHPAMLEAETDAVFAASWLCVGRADEVPEPGDYYTLDLIGEPLLVTRSDALSLIHI